jgi:hypothetical protein
MNGIDWDSMDVEPWTLKCAHCSTTYGQHRTHDLACPAPAKRRVWGLPERWSSVTQFLASRHG